MTNINSGVYRPQPKRLRITPKKPEKMVKNLAVRLQYCADLLAKYIKAEYSEKGLQGISELTPMITALDKVANTYLKVISKAKTLEGIPETGPSLGDMLTEDLKDDKQADS